MVIKKPQLKWYQELYLWEIFRGMLITLRHFILGVLRPERFPTLYYPEVKHKMRENYRGKHRLTLKDDGSVRCTACMLCATACPADCIYIDGAEHPDPKVEKFPTRFEIDMLRCVFCGLCVEACPCDAIRMDTGEYDLGDYRRADLVFKKESLMRK